MNKAIKLLRIYSGIRAVDLARELGLSSTSISEMESGKKGVPQWTLEKYSAYFGIKVSSIVRFSEKLEKDKKLEKKMFANIIAIIEGIE